TEAGAIYWRIRSDVLAAAGGIYSSTLSLTLPSEPSFIPTGRDSRLNRNGRHERPAVNSCFDMVEILRNDFWSEPDLLRSLRNFSLSRNRLNEESFRGLGICSPGIIF